MKKEYPDYRKSGTESIYKKLNSIDKDVLERFLTFCRSSSQEYKVNCRKSELLQMEFQDHKKYFQKLSVDYLYDIGIC